MSSPPPEYTSRPSSLRPPRPSYEAPSLSPSPSPPPPGGAAGGPGQLGKVYPQHWQTPWQTHDPRSSSAQSLVPSIDDGDHRRTLLVVYIHGFMGNDTSFQSFPAHVHNYLRQALFETHAIHSKIYPRYKTYKAIDVARDNFSRWLEPHESETTDVVLVGHSMGGILAADIVLIPSPNPVMRHPYKHRILGTVSLDSPFLGLHPGIIVSGIASLFRKDEEQTQQPGYPNAVALEPNTSGSLSPDPSLYNELNSLSSGMTSPSTLTTVSSASSPPPGDGRQADPFFNPPFFNDVQFRDRGWWKNIAHFTKKHRAEGIFSSAANHIVSHLEFGGCLADYPALNNRYSRLRRLEDVDDFNAAGTNSPARGDAQVRFVNYFTISTGRLKKQEPPPLPPRSPPPPTKPASPFLRPKDAEEPRKTSGDGSSPGSTPRISIEDHSDDGRPVSMQYIDPEPLPDDDHEKTPDATSSGDAAPPDPVDTDTKPSTTEEPTNDPGGGSIARENTLPAIPDAPQPPQPPNLDQYVDKEERKQAEKEAKRAQKAYEQAVKNRDKAVKEREKLIEKRRKQALKDEQKRDKDAQKRRAREEKEERAALQKEISELNLAGGSSSSKDAAASSASVSSAPVPSTPGSSSQQQQHQEKEEKAKKKKERKFCMLPMKGPNGARDPAWVRVDMEGVDEVGAHCGLFFPGPHYEKLVGDVGSRIVGWVQEDASKRAILALD